jgi:hypothetical protein
VSIPVWASGLTYCNSVALVTIGATTSSDSIRCPIAIDTNLDSDSAKIGQPVEGTLKQSLQMNATYNAPPGSKVIGHVWKEHKLVLFLVVKGVSIMMVA